jgi:hypothetical protein
VGAALYGVLTTVFCSPGAVNLVVSACQLTPTLAKAMIYQLDRFVPFDHVYSGSQIGELAATHCATTSRRLSATLTRPLA